MGHSIFFSIEAEQPLPNGQIIMIQVQDLATSEYFTYQNSSCNNTPKVKAGTTVYMAAWAVNNGGAGYMTLSLFVGSTRIATKRGYVAAGDGFGIESSVDGTNPIINDTQNCEARV